jgi:hypothetical protein
LICGIPNDYGRYPNNDADPKHCFLQPHSPNRTDSALSPVSRTHKTPISESQKDRGGGEQDWTVRLNGCTENDAIDTQ